MTNQIIEMKTGEIIEVSAQEINQEHKMFTDSMNRGLEHAIRCGELLIEQKKQLSHGEWLPWVMANCDFSNRRAEQYMTLANSNRCSNLEGATSIHSALKLLQEENRPKKPALPKPVGVFSWFHDPDILAGEEGEKALDIEIKILLSADTDIGVANHLLNTIRERLTNKIKLIDKKISEGRI